MRINDMKIKTKMLVFFNATAIILMLVVMVLTTNMTQNAIISNIMEVSGRIATDAVVAGLELEAEDEVAAALAAFTKQELFSYLRVTDKSGKEVFVYRKDGLPELKPQQGQELEKTSEEEFHTAPVESNGKRVGAVTLGVYLPALSKFIASVRLAIGILALVVVGVFVGIIILIANMIAKPTQQITNIAQQIARGNLDQEISIQRGDEVGMLANAFREMIEYIKGLAAAVEALSRNDLSVKIKPKSESDILSISIIRTIETLHEMANETKILTAASRDGDLKIRGNGAKFKGVYRELIEGVNATLDAVIAPLNEAAEVLQNVAARDLSARVQGDYKGEYLKIKVALNQAAREMATALRQINQYAGTLATSSAQLKTVSHQLSSNAEETSAQTSVVSAAAEEVSKSVQTVASSAEEMGASIREIAKNATEAAKVAAQAVQTTEDANATVAKLGNSSAEIGNVVKVITSIAEQTNLLALNATIEAARAGEAGKGFAVVANEVKELAKETAKATEDISKKIEAIQQDTGNAVQAIGQISGVIKQINDISNTIASAVEEQSVTTKEITRNIAEAARGSSEIAQNISAIAQAAQSTNAGASNTLNAAEELSSMAEELQKLIEQFKYDEPESGFARRDSKWEDIPLRVVDDVKLLAARRNKALMPSRS